MSLSGNSSGYEQTLSKNNLQIIELQFYINNIASCIGIVVILSARIQDNQFITLKSDLLSYKLIVYKSHNNPNLSTFLTITPSRSTLSRSMTYKNHQLFSLLPILPHRFYRNLTLTIFALKWKPWITTFTMTSKLKCKPWMTTFMMTSNSWLKNLCHTSKTYICKFQDRQA